MKLLKEYIANIPKVLKELKQDPSKVITVVLGLVKVLFNGNLFWFRYFYTLVRLSY